MKTGIAFVGCGYVADLYIAGLAAVADEINLVGVFDVDARRAEAFAAHYGLKSYRDMAALLADASVEIVVNLTNPKFHYDVSMQALSAGKHVYSEKPLALTLKEAEHLIGFSRDCGLHIVAAPSTFLGEAAQTLARAVRDRIAGTPRLAYVEIDDGMLHQIGMENWRSFSGIPWPAKDELETGCTLEHAGYVLSWLVPMFGSATRVVSFAKLLIDDKGAATPDNYSTPDFSCACVEFESGVVARITNSIVAPHDHRFRVFCDNGHLELLETWDFEAKVSFFPVAKTRLRRQLQKRLGWSGRKRVPSVRTRKIDSAPQGANLDFMIGIADMANAIHKGKKPRLGGDFSLHITEVSLAIQHPETYGTDYRVVSKAPPVEPMPWAL